jgi:hypothetical protein
MEYIYANWRPQMHRSLSDRLKALDRLSILTFCGRLLLLDDLFNATQGISPALKPVLEQMLHVRTTYRSRCQRQDDPDNVFHRLIMLQKLKTSNMPAKVLADFVLVSETPRQIVAVISHQALRVSLLKTSFQLVADCFSICYSPILTEIFAFGIAKIHVFDRLSRILRLSNLGTEDFIQPVFTNFLRVLRERPMGKISLICFRIFRDCAELLTFKRSFLDRALDYFCNVHPGDLSLFALCLSIIDCLESLPVVLKMDSETSPMISLLLSVALLHIQCDETFYMTFRQAFWTPRAGTERILCRVMFRILNSSLIADELVRAELEALVQAVGQKFLDFTESGLSAASEMIWIIRRILVEKTRARPVLESILLGTPRGDAVRLCGLFAILGATIENIRPYCNIKYHENRSSAQDFIAVPTSHEFEFKCYFRPFNIRQPARYIKLAPHITVYAVPVIELCADSFPHFDFILSFFGQCMASLVSIVSSLYVQVVAHYLRFPAFVALATPAMAAALSRLYLPFDTIYGTWLLLRKLQHVRVVPECCGFQVLGFEPSPFVSYLSRQLAPGAAVHVHVRLAGDDFPAYFGLVTDAVATRFTRFSIVEVPSGTVYPHFWRTEEFADPRAVDFEVDLSARRLVWGAFSAALHPPQTSRRAGRSTAKSTVRGSANSSVRRKCG